MSDTAATRHYHLQLAAAALLGMLVRLRFVFTPISPDEGGYLAQARAWRHGATIYRDVWVDRPQGLLALFRFYDMLGLSEAHVRLIAVVFGVLAVVSVGEAVRMLAGRNAGVAAALLAAVLVGAPAIEGFQANGELLGGAFSAASLAVGVAVLTGVRSRRWMYVAGLLAAAGWSMKQSGIDGPLAVVLWLSVAGVARWVGRREALHHAGRMLAGAVVGVAPMVLHALLTEWSGWWYAIIGYRQEGRSAFVGANWSALQQTWIDAAPVLLPTAFVVAFLAIGLRHTGRLFPGNRVALVLLLWLFTAGVTFVAGGQFFHHYWVILAFPISALGGLMIGALTSWWRALALTLALAIPVATTVPIIAQSRRLVDTTIKGDTQTVRVESAGLWLREHMGPGDTLLSLCSGAAVYAYAHADPPYPYLWYPTFLNGRGGQEKMIALMEGDSRPNWLVLIVPVKVCNPTGEVEAVIEARYQLVAMVDELAIMRLVSDDSSL